MRIFTLFRLSDAVRLDVRLVGIDDHEARPAVDARRVDAPAVRAHDALGDRQAKPRAARLGREPGREELRRIDLEPRPVVPHHELARHHPSGSSHSDAPATARRVDRVGDEIDEHLRRLVRVAAHRRVPRNCTSRARARERVAEQHLDARREIDNRDQRAARCGGRRCCRRPDTSRSRRSTSSQPMSISSSSRLALCPCRAGTRRGRS